MKNARGRRRIRTSEKLMLDQRVKFKLGEVYKWGEVQWWILNHPLTVYKHVYESKKYNLRPLQLTYNGIRLLKKELSARYPKLLLQIEYRRTKHRR